MKLFFHDWETQSEADIRKLGTALYLEHPTTRPLVLCYALDQHPVQQALLDGQHIQSGLYGIAADPEVFFVAHNAPFERRAWQQFMVPLGYPDVPLHRWICTMSMALAAGIPAKLELAAKAMSLPVQKDMDGNAVMKKLAKPRRITKNNSEKFWTPETAPEDFKKLYEYCATDVETTRLLFNAIPQLSEYERKVWLLDQEMNDRGVRLDLDTIYKATDLIEDHLDYICDEFKLIIPGVEPTQREQVRSWLASKGLHLRDMQAATLDAKRKDPNLAHEFKRVLELYAEANKTSLAKYGQMVARSCARGIARDNLRYHGAGPGRWTGSGIQLHNMARPTENGDMVVQAIQSLDYEAFSFIYPNVSEALSSGVRGMILPDEGNELFVGDFASIEAIVLAWLAGQDNVLETFRQDGELYCAQAAATFGVPITKKDPRRQVGKVQILAYGYQGGIAAGSAMGKTYRLDIRALIPLILYAATPQEREAAGVDYLLYCKRTPLIDQIGKEEAMTLSIMKQRYRDANPHIVNFWFKLEQAVIQAVERPGAIIHCGRVAYYVENDWLICSLPSGRKMRYHQPRLHISERGKKVVSYQSYDPTKGHHGRVDMYGGLEAENATQATARDFMVNSMFSLSEHDYDLLLSVHDEVVAQRLKGKGSAQQMKELMEILPPWGAGVPLKVEVWQGDRYGKH